MYLYVYIHNIYYAIIVAYELMLGDSGKIRRKKMGVTENKHKKKKKPLSFIKPECTFLIILFFNSFFFILFCLFLVIFLLLYIFLHILYIFIHIFFFFPSKGHQTKKCQITCQFQLMNHWIKFMLQKH